MKILLRIVMVVALLCGLGYGSYAFGRYVLTNKLFGEAKGPIRSAQSASEANAVTYHTNWKGDKPRVEVKLMPANGEGPPTDITDGVRDTTIEVAPPSGPGKNTKKTFDDAYVQYGDDYKEGGERRHRRSRRSKIKTDEAASKVKAESETPEATPAREDVESEGGDSASVDVSAEGDKPVEVKPEPSEPRTETRRPEPRSESRRERRRRSRRPRKERTESPVPKPEGSGSSSASSSKSSSSSSSSGGGDSADISPVPQPE